MDDDDFVWVLRLNSDIRAVFSSEDKAHRFISLAYPSFREEATARGIWKGPLKVDQLSHNIILLEKVVIFR